MARAELGDGGGLADYSEAIALASKAGQGRDVALLHNNYGMALWCFEGPSAALEVIRAGADFAKARGLNEVTSALMQSRLDALVDLGELGEVVVLASEIAPILEAIGNIWDLTGIRSAQLRVLCLRGEASDAGEMIDWLESSSRHLEGADDVVQGLGPTALARAALGQNEVAEEQLAEIEAFPVARGTPYYAVFLPAMVRSALAIGNAELAERFVAGYEPRYPYAEHALVAARAVLAEARGDLVAAADAYADSADRWERFGVVPEQGFALMGQGRCLLGLSQPTEAIPALQHAREIFERLKATPVLAETAQLLHRAAELMPSEH